MLTDNDVIADLARLRERSADIEYTGEIPLTRRSSAATVAPIAALAALATVGASVLDGSSGDRRGPDGGVPSAAETTASPDGGPATPAPVDLVDAQITLAGKVITYRHPVGEDPFAPGWQAAVIYGDGLPADVTELTATDGSPMWVTDAPAGESGRSVLIGFSGPDGNTGERIYAGLMSDWSRADLEAWVRDTLHGR